MGGDKILIWFYARCLFFVRAGGRGYTALVSTQHEGGVDGGGPGLGAAVGVAAVVAPSTTAAVETKAAAADRGLRWGAGGGSTGRSDWTEGPATASIVAVAGADGGGTGATDWVGIATPRGWFAAAAGG